jgi:hypothetical protein
MKNNILYILLFSILKISAQEKIDSTLLVDRKKYFELGEKALKNSNIYYALSSFHTFCFLNDINSETQSNYRIIAGKKIDSLLTLFQKKELKKWKGKWKLKQLTTTKYNYEYIEITKTEVRFFDKFSKIPIRVEKIQFAPYDSGDLIISYSKLLFNNNEIWEFGITNSKNEKRLVIEVKRDENGEQWFLLDERGIIKDPVARKIALEKEIRTYYILEK